MRAKALPHSLKSGHPCGQVPDPLTGSYALDHARLTTLWDVLCCHAEHRPDEIATVFEGRDTSYAQLNDLALRLALVLTEQIKPGDRIGYLGKNSDHYFVLLFALARIGAVMVPLNWRLAADELAFIVDDSTMRALYSDAEFDAFAHSLAGKAGILAQRLDHAVDAVSETRGAVGAGVIGMSLPKPENVVFQVYTSGTTGRPKGAMLTHMNLLALRAPGYRAGLDWFPRPDSTVAVVLPVAHIAGTAYAMFGFYAGAKVVLLREFDPGDVLALIARQRVSNLLLAPAAMQMVMEHPDASRSDLSALEVITYGAAPIPEALLRDALALFRCGFVQMYGMSEAAGGVVALQPDDHISGVAGRLRAAGTAMPGVEIAICDDDWNCLPANAIGEIIVRSAAVMPGYWNRPDATAETINADGWMRTGDIGRIDQDGYVFVLDRAKDMIISGGENIYPAEVENAIFGHPDVADVAVVGAPSARWGEEVVAIIVPRPGTEPTHHDIGQWLDGKLARFKLPKQIVLAESLPRNAGNKILRRVLRERFWEGHERRVN